MTLFSPKLLYWIKILSKYISVQLIVQALGFINGIFLVRTLDQKEYAYYTIAITMQTTMLLLADMGVGVGISAIGGKVWQDKYRFGQLINTALQLRTYLAGGSIIVITPIMVWMLMKNGASPINTGLIVIVVLVGLHFQLTTIVLNVIPQLHSQISRLQKLDLLFGVSRVILLGIAYLIYLNTVMAIAAASIATGLQRYLLGYWIADSVDTKASINQEDRKFLLAQVIKLAPNGIFFCLQNQISIWLISLFGSTKDVAEAGALGRIGIIFLLISSVMGNIIIPSFIRCQSAKMLQRRYFQILGCFLIFGIMLIAITALFPRQLLWILGNKYSHLQNELLLMMIYTVFSAIIGAMWSLNAAKAWVQYAWVEIPMRIITQIILLITLDVSSVKGVLLFSILSSIPPFLVNTLLTYRGFKTFEQSTV